MGAGSVSASSAWMRLVLQQRRLSPSSGRDAPARASACPAPITFLYPGLREPGEITQVPAGTPWPASLTRPHPSVPPTLAPEQGRGAGETRRSRARLRGEGGKDGRRGAA